MQSEFQRRFSAEMQNELRALSAREQRRSLAEISGVNLCSNDYLGLAERAELRQAVLAAVADAPRLGGTGSRLLSGQASIWDELESEFAGWVGTDAALYFGSGYAANIGLLTSIAGRDDLILSDAANHASLIDGVRLSGARKYVYPHADLNHLETALREHHRTRGRKLIVTETIFSMSGDVAQLREIFELAERYDAGVILDEAHATAVHGPGGRGIGNEYVASGHLVAAVHTCGKALASAGAFVCGSTLLKDYLVNHARSFIFTTALPPYMGAQIRAALRLAHGMDAERANLRLKAQRLVAALHAEGLDTANSTTQIIPVILGENEAALSSATFLQERGFAVRAIRPPTVAAGASRLRLSLATSIADSELARLAETLKNWQGLQRETVAAGVAAGTS
jgi:8-amino-7-oxononanoate synthase